MSILTITNICNDTLDRIRLGQFREGSGVWRWFGFNLQSVVLSLQLV